MREQYEDKPHDIILVGGTILRDGHQVKVIVNTENQSVMVGCTWITRAALLRIVEWSTNSFPIKERVVQEGIQ